MHGRLLDCTLPDPYSNLALEEALFRSLEKPVLRVWDNQRSVVIGRAQLASVETDLERCRAKSIPVVRRFTAGGAVYNGPGNVNWTFLQARTQGDGKPGVFGANSVFSTFADAVVRALTRCSVYSRFEPPNRIVNLQGKISGMAAFMSSKGVICHGTLLVDADLREVQRVSRPDPLEVDRRYPRSVNVRVANCGVDRMKFVKALAAETDVEYEEASLTREEGDLATRLADEKYTDERWNLGDPFASDDL